MAEDAVHDYVIGDVPPDMVTEVEKLFAVDIPQRVWEITTRWADELLDIREEVGGDPVNADEEIRKRRREMRFKRR